MHETIFFIRSASKIHSDQTVKFPYVARSRYQYLMIVLTVDTNSIFAAPFRNNTKEEQTKTYLKIKKNVDKRGLVIDMWDLDNEALESDIEAIKIPD